MNVNGNDRYLCVSVQYSSLLTSAWNFNLGFTGVRVFDLFSHPIPILFPFVPISPSIQRIVTQFTFIFFSFFFLDVFFLS